MFQIGDQIVYPMHGAGTIEAIEEREIQGKVQQYYVIKMASSMQVMIPVNKMSHSSIRSVTKKVDLEKVLGVFHHEEPDHTQTWKQRFTSNMEKVKSGNMLEGAEVVRDLMIRNEEKKLNSSERQMLYNAKKILVSELGIINGITENQASDLLEEKMLGVIAQAN
ncbi:CarD family transcriptional regulator [Mesobacillus maritimus]|uniref:Transcription factor YdeB n=1 Tax=Mesobacillus maritimus TaxID=1643336 RepID=A0ABS7K9B8_9BACI|nr:CarD family transcriptional regulator [Mesobacillus maritimus]MBY0098856.1 transcription factor YdeB [Mesobacillus maritimus]